MPRPKLSPVPPPDEPDDISLDDAVQAALDYEAQQRLWLRVLLPYIWDDHPTHASRCVEFGRDLVRLAACQRVCRILRSDLPEGSRAAEARIQEQAIAAEAPAER